MFANAALLFGVEPMVTKLVLPVLGGAPSVWNTALMFFQGALLVGYGWAHLSARLSPSHQLVAHAVLVLVSCLALPLQLHLAGAPPASGTPIPWLLATLLLTVGAPFTVLAAGAPLLQRWFSLGAPDRDPYVLYAASNAGSLLALLAYPLVVEPTLSLAAQRALWSLAYATVGAAVVCAAWWTWRALARREEIVEIGEIGVSTRTPAGDRVLPPVSPVTWRDRGRWLALSAVPSSLLLGTTTYITTDIASVPLLWVLPLALYLVTFVIAYARPSAGAPRWLLHVEAYALIATALVLSWTVRFGGLWPIAYFCTMLFIVAWCCHAELARRRPAPAALTEYYLLMAVGGLLGSVFNVLVAPVLFDGVHEYPIALAAAALLRPSRATDGEPRSTADRRLDLLLPLAMLVAMFVGARFRVLDDIAKPAGMMLALAVGLALALSTPWTRRFGLGIAALLFTPLVYKRLDPPDSLLHVERSFFGTYRVVSNDGRTVRLLHGTTIHGVQSRVHRERPLSYYEITGPAGAILGRPPAGLPPRRVGIVGLGIGSLACYGRPGEAWTFFEIDPVVLRIARDGGHFTYLRSCPPTKRYVIGDARESLRRERAGAFDYLVLDAFSSDAIPVHLMTREAFADYMNALAPEGVLAVHISNLYLDLEPVVAALAMSLGLQGRVWHDLDRTTERVERGWYPSTWIVLARTDVPLDRIARSKDWRPLRAPGVLWTDDYSNLVGTLR